MKNRLFDYYNWRFDTPLLVNEDIQFKKNKEE